MRVMHLACSNVRTLSQIAPSKRNKRVQVRRSHPTVCLIRQPATWHCATLSVRQVALRLPHSLMLHLHLLLRRGLLRAAPSGTTGGKRAVWFHGAGIGNGAPARQHGVLLPSARAGQCPVKTTGGSSSKTGPSLSLAVYLPVSPWHPCIPNVEWVT